MMKTITYVIDEHVVTTVTWIELLKRYDLGCDEDIKLYSQLKRFWCQECLNWNLGTYMKFTGMDKREEGERGKGGTLNCLLPFPPFIMWSAYWSLPPRSAAKKGGGYYITESYKIHDNKCFVV
jgi:hypothetical protein